MEHVVDTCFYLLNVWPVESRDCNYRVPLPWFSFLLSYVNTVHLRIERIRRSIIVDPIIIMLHDVTIAKLTSYLRDFNFLP